MKTLKYLFMIPFALISCDSYLDEYPDNRMELDSPEDVASLLVSAYPEVNPAYLCEMYSDNTDQHVSTLWSAASRFQMQAYNWQDITEISDNESPLTVWNTHYQAIASANAAISHIESLPAEEQAKYSEQLGEALLCRAYSHFVLSEVFCMSYDPATADKELGIPYVKEVQTTLDNNHDRGTLSETYSNIADDIEYGLALVGNAYSTPKFHFTPSSANAFATRFYLYYRKFDKALECANKVLGSNPSSMMRDWQSFYSLSANGQVAPNAYVSSTEKANLMVGVFYSQWGCIYGPYQVGDAYSHGTYISDYETLGANGPWGASRNIGYTIWHNDALSKNFISKIPYDFEYTDLQAGIGYPHAAFPLFNTDYLILERAEIKALMGDLDGAVADINTQLGAFSCGKMSVTLKDINAFYDALSYYTPYRPTPKKEFHTTLPVGSKEQENVLQTVLQLRRIVGLAEGNRLQDVKRYGIKMYRRCLNTSNEITAVTDSMSAGDPRLAIQLPQDVISAGLEANPRQAK